MKEKNKYNKLDTKAFKKMSKKELYNINGGELKGRYEAFIDKIVSIFIRE